MLFPIVLFDSVPYVLLFAQLQHEGFNCVTLVAQVLLAVYIYNHADAICLEG